MALGFKNDSQRLMDELEALELTNEPLYNLVQDLCQYVEDKYQKDVIITMILRTQEEQDAIYKGKTSSDGRKYDETPWKSPHQFGNSIDIRSHVFTKKEIYDIENYLNSKYDNTNYHKWTAKNHNVGLGDHFHIQYLKVKEKK